MPTANQLRLPHGSTCRIVPVGKRRDGGTRFWCLLHKANATAKYGKAATQCRYGHIPVLAPSDIYTLDVSHFPGGIALWGAVAPVYDTTRLPLDRGIHVHARRRPSGPKECDRSYRAVRLIGGALPADGVMLSELDAIYYMVSSVFDYDMKSVRCTHCDHSHLDRDWFSVHPHRRHLCAACGKQFSDVEVGIGNPICAVRALLGCGQHRTKKAKKKLNIRQADYPGGLQIWGSNTAFVWTGSRSEEEGIHVHAFGADSEEMENNTFGQVIIDGVRLDPRMVRILMAQSALPHIAGRVAAVRCGTCGETQFAAGANAFTPSSEHVCSRCGHSVAARGRLRKTIGNPLIGILEQLAGGAPRTVQKHDLGLIPETL